MTKTKASDAIPTKTQGAQTEEGAQTAHQAGAGPAAAGNAAALVPPQAAAEVPPVHNPKHGGLYRQEGTAKPVVVHRTLHPDELPAA